jgi:hypothetical protein
MYCLLRLRGLRNIQERHSQVGFAHQQWIAGRIAAAIVAQRFQVSTGIPGVEHLVNVWAQVRPAAEKANRDLRLDTLSKDISNITVYVLMCPAEFIGP